MRSNISRTSSARCLPEGSLPRDPPGTLPTPPTQLLGGFFYPRLGYLVSLLGDDVEEASEVRSPRLQGDLATRGDKSRAVADHTARHRHEPWLVQARYRLDRQRVGVVPDQDINVGRPAPFGVGCGDKAGLVLAGSQVDPAGEHVPEEVLERPRVRGRRRGEICYRAAGEEYAHHRADLVYGDGLAPPRGGLGHALLPAVTEILEPVVEARTSRGAQRREPRGHRERVARK